MATFKVQVTEKVMSVQIYEVEAESGEEAVELYASELAGSIEPVNYYERPIQGDEQEDITCVD